MQAFILGEEIGARPPDANVGPFIGRTEELALLEAAFGDAAIVTVVGDAGIGKSRLVVEGLARTGRGSLIVRGEPNGLTSPYRAVRDAFRSILGIERADAATMGAQLEGSVRRIDPELLPLLPLLGTVAHIATPMTPEVGAVDPQFLPEQLGVAVRRLLEAVLPEGAVLVVDDAQWTDPASNALLGRLAVAAERGRRWSMVVVRRDARWRVRARVAPAASRADGRPQRSRAAEAVDERAAPTRRGPGARQPGRGQPPRARRARPAGS